MPITSKSETKITWMDWIKGWWRVLSLNVLVESIVSDEKEGMQSFTDISNILALVEALIAVMAVTPFLSLQADYEMWGDTWLARINVVCLLLLLVASMINL